MVLQMIGAAYQGAPLKPTERYYEQWQPDGLTSRHAGRVEVPKDAPVSFAFDFSAAPVEYPNRSLGAHSCTQSVIPASFT